MGIWYLYQLIKYYLNEEDVTLQISFNDIRGDIRNCGVYIDEVPTNKRDIKDGTYYNFKSKTHIELVSKQNKSDILKTLSILSNVKQSMILACSTVYNATGNQCVLKGSGNIELMSDSNVTDNDSAIGTFELLQVDVLSGVTHLGKNKLGLARYSLDLYITYGIKERSN